MTNSFGASGRFPTDVFADAIAGNASFVESFVGTTLGGRAAKGLALVTCMDSRIEPLPLLGMGVGDVKILRNAGARVTDDVLRTLVLATYLLGVDRVLVMPHTDCKMASTTEANIHKTIFDDYGVDTRSEEFRTVEDQEVALVYDVTRIRAFPLLPENLTVAGAIYDVMSGAILPRDI
ncbi:MAG: carbonic anhydrase [Actinomycetes bacterium]|jgi:carbonic anhydrase